MSLRPPVAQYLGLQIMPVLSDGLDLTGYGSAAMTLYRYVDDDLDGGEYLGVGVLEDGGTRWISAYDW